MSASHKVSCDDGIERTFHQAGIYTRNGFVYVNHRRVYGTSTEVYTAGKGYHHLFQAKGANAHLVAPVREPEAVSV